MFKKYLLVVTMLLVATNVWSAKVMNVTGTKHNLGSFGGQPAAATNEDEVCIFCHTPHGGSLNAPLWNRAQPSQTFLHYSSATLSTYMKGLATNRAVSAESLLCMSCHDGAVSMNSIINVSNRTGAPPNNVDPMPTFWVSPGGVIGEVMDAGGNLTGATNNLTDDHPISFSYWNAALDPLNAGKLNTAVFAKGKGIRFFGPDASGQQRVECSSCHDPHVDATTDQTFGPFLTMANTKSALCLACHNK